MYRVTCSPYGRIVEPEIAYLAARHATEPQIQAMRELDRATGI